MRKPPVRLCCFKRHWGVICPDKLVMCQLCYKRFPIEGLNVVNGIPEDVCKGCAKLEEQVANCEF